MGWSRDFHTFMLIGQRYNEEIILGSFLNYSEEIGLHNLIFMDYKTPWSSNGFKYIQR